MAAEELLAQFVALVDELTDAIAWGAFVDEPTAEAVLQALTPIEGELTKADFDGEQVAQHLDAAVAALKEAAAA